MSVSLWHRNGAERFDRSDALGLPGGREPRELLPRIPATTERGMPHLTQVSKRVDLGCPDVRASRVRPCVLQPWLTDTLPVGVVRDEPGAGPRRNTASGDIPERGAVPEEER
jgi:hypothetical protein